MVDAWPGREFEGAVFAIDPAIDADTRNINAKANLHNPERALRPGMFATIKLRVRENDMALLIPEETLIPKGKQQHVMKLVDGKAQTVEVKIGTRRDGKVEITEGLATGDIVITAGHMKLQDGMPAQPMQSPVPAAEAQEEPAAETE